MADGKTTYRFATWMAFSGLDWPLHGAIARSRILRRLRDEGGREGRIGRVKRGVLAVHGLAQVVDVAMDERSADARSVGDVQLVTRGLRDTTGQRVPPEDRIHVAAARAVVVHTRPVAGERAVADG